jgi:hypothetical protein
MSKIFIWEFINNLTKNWHSDGGLVVVADSLYDAVVNASMDHGVEFTDEESKKPSAVYDLSCPAEDKVFIFPNAGCC